jgi:hypothetical protein
MILILQKTDVTSTSFRLKTLMNADQCYSPSVSRLQGFGNMLHHLFKDPLKDIS